MVFERVEQLVHIATEAVTLEGLLVIPAMAQGMVLFAHGSGSSRHSPRNTYVAQILQCGGFGTLLLSLETPAEAGTYGPRFDIDLLAGRLVAVTRWLHAQPPAQDLTLGYFGAGTGAAVALSGGLQRDRLADSLCHHAQPGHARRPLYHPAGAGGMAGALLRHPPDADAARHAAVPAAGGALDWPPGRLPGAAARWRAWRDRLVERLSTSHRSHTYVPNHAPLSPET